MTGELERGVNGVSGETISRSVIALTGGRGAAVRHQKEMHWQVYQSQLLSTDKVIRGR